MEINDFIERYDKFHFFWATDSPFSQWHRSIFRTQDGTIFNTAEQYMMYTKAITFFADDIAARILETSDPRKQKKLGRSIPHFDSEVWDKVKRDTVYTGNLLKFDQNKDLLKLLTDTKDSYLVEASPYDTVWGIGMLESDKGVEDPSNWRGENLLGNILTELRTYFILRNTNRL